MKLLKYIFFLSSIILLASCSDDDDKDPGNPIMDIKTEFNSAMFGDSLPFTINVSDEVPLSTLKARVYFGEEIVSEVVIRTKTGGDYSSKIYIPYLKETPDGTARLEFVLQNINFTLTSKVYDLTVTRPVYPYLTFVTADKEYRMEHTTGYNYELTETLPQKIKGYIKTPTVSSVGNEITFGVEGDAITHGSENNITFSNLTSGEYTIAFNTFDYSASPFIVAYAINATVMERVDDDNFTIDLSLTQGESITVDGIDDFSEWWIDSDYFAGEAGSLTFNPISGKYRISADFKLKYLKVEVMSGDKLAGLNADGTGAIWIIGDSQGKPTSANSGWDPSKAICMAPMGNGKYQTSFVAGKTLVSDKINFVFFQVKDWSPSFGPETLTVNSDLVLIGLGQAVNGIDKGNIALAKDKTLTEGKTYVFIVDVSAGIDKAVLTVDEK